MKSFVEVVDAFGGVTAYAKAMGQTRYWAKKVRERKSLNASHFAATAVAAQAKGLPITVDTLARIAAERTGDA